MFEVGQKVVCITDIFISDSGLGITPKKNEVVTVSGHSKDGDGYIRLREYPYSRSGKIQEFNPAKFRPLQPNEELSSLTIEQLLNETVEV